MFSGVDHILDFFPNYWVVLPEIADWLRKSTTQHRFRGFWFQKLFSLLSILPNGPSLSVELDRLVDCVRHHFKDDDEQYSEASQAP